MHSSPESPEPVTASPLGISLRGVSQVFGSFVALRDLSLDLPAGSSVMLLGPNGAGKSTLLRLLAGLSTPSYGEVRVFGARPEDLRGRIAYMSHSTMLYDELTGPENLDYLLILQRPEMNAVQRRQHVGNALVAVGLEPDEHAPPGPVLAGHAPACLARPRAARRTRSAAARRALLQPRRQPPHTP